NPFSLWMQTWLPIILTAILIIVVVVQAKIYNRQANIMDATLKQANETRIIENRAYVNVKEVKMRTPILNAIAANQLQLAGTAVVYFGNTGKTPARNFHGTVAIGIHSDDSPNSLVAVDANTNQFKGKFIIPPNGQSFVETRPKGEFNREQLTALISKQSFIYIWGTVEYEDVFGEL